MGSHIPRDSRRQKVNEHDQTARQRRNSFKQYLRDINERLSQADDIDVNAEVFLVLEDGTNVDITTDILLVMEEMDLLHGPVDSIEDRAFQIGDDLGYTDYQVSIIR